MTVAPEATIGGNAPRERALHGHGPGVLAVQLLLEPADQQQGVVGAGTEHEHGEDALALPVDGEDPGLGDQVDDGLGQHQRHAGRHQDRQEDRAAVDEQQDHQDDADGGEQQLAVDALERGREVGELSTRAGDVARQAVDLRRPSVDVLDDAGQRLERRVVARAAGAPPAPPRRPRSGSAATAAPAMPSTSASRSRASLDRSEVGVGQAAGSLPDDQGRDVLVAGEPGLQLERLGRLGRVGQERGLVVLGDAGQLAGQRAGDRRHDEERDQQHDGRQQHAPPVDAAMPPAAWVRCPLAGACLRLDQPVVARHLVLLLCSKPSDDPPQCSLDQARTGNSSGVIVAPIVVDGTDSAPRPAVRRPT